MKTTHELVIVFNEFFDRPCRYVEVVSNADTGELIERIPLARKPRAARFDAVFENGSGDHNSFTAPRAVQLHKHPLLRS